MPRELREVWRHTSAIGAVRYFEEGEDRARLNQQRYGGTIERLLLLTPEAAAERDAERLEWLQCNGCEVVCHDPENDASHWELRYTNPDDIDGAPLVADGSTLREAIDAALTGGTTDAPL
jgi:hypothetical protein